jgi:hypothetical protein
LGDTLQFCRYVPRVAALAADVILEVPAVLVPLLEGLPGVRRLVALGTDLPAFDCHCPLLSLPFAFRTTLEDIPAGEPYIRAREERTERWRRRLGPKSRPRVGIAWSGNPRHRNDRNRSLALGSLLPCLGDRVEVVSLQKDLREPDAALVAQASAARHFGAELEDFADTAALVELMDLVIAVDTSVAHLAGAMGKPAWILLPFNPDWRWLLDREDSPWYPSMRLFRQRAPGDWDGVLAEVQAALARRFAPAA